LPLHSVGLLEDHRRHRVRLSAFLAILLTILPNGAACQAVVGSAVDARSGAPIGGAFVTLSDEEGVPQASSLTNSTGRFTLRAPAEGRYRLRAERIGYEATEQGPVVVEPGRTAEVTVQLTQRAIPLEGIAVQAESRCEIRPETGRLTARLWDEVSTVLRVARWSESAGLFRFRVAEWERELDPRRLGIREETRREGIRVLDQSPFVSAPVAELQAEGYIRDVGDGQQAFYAPDAAVLLSDEFLDGHCFRARADDPPEDGWIGLAFEPVERSSFADVEGVLWVEASTSELQRLDYTYTRQPAGLRDDRVGGQVEFERVPEGPWIVSRWAIRMPMIRMPMVDMPVTELRGLVTRTRPDLVGFREEGGEVLDVWLADDSTIPMAPLRPSAR
jgi:hypothetical protein